MSLAWRALTVSQWSWFQDDWVYLTQATRLGVWDYVFQNYNGHIMPAQFALAWLMARVAPLDHSWAVLSVLAFTLASLVAWTAALRAIFGPRLRLLFVLVLLGLSPMLLPVTLWWAAAIQILPMQLALGLCTLFTARFLLHGRRRSDLVLLGCSYAGGLLFWEKAILLAIPVAFLTLMIGSGTLTERLRSGWRVVAMVVSLSLLYVPLYVALTRDGDAARTTFQLRGLAESLDFYVSGVLDVGLPALVGGPWSQIGDPQSLLAAPSAVKTILLMAAAISAVVLAAIWRRTAIPAVLMTVAYAVVSWGLVLMSSRYGALGNLTVRDARYAADILPVALLTCAFLITPTRAEQEQAEWLRPPFRLGRVTGRALVGLALAGVTISSLVANGIAWDSARPNSPKPWVDNLVADAKGASTASVYNSVAPDNVILSGYFWEQGRLATILAPLSLPLQFDRPGTPMLIAASDGHLKPVRIEEASHSLTPAPIPDCGYLVKPGESTVIPLTQPLFRWQWGYQIDYFSQLGGSAVLRTSRSETPFAAPAGLRRLNLVVEDAATSLTLTATPSSGPLCITEVSIGRLTASGAPG